MPTWLAASLASLATGLLSLLGGIGLLIWPRLERRVLRLLVSFAAGAMLAAALVDILPEALRQAEHAAVGPSMLAAIIAFFLAEKFLHWHHHSHEHSASEVKAYGALVILGDTFHNLLDGFIIGLTFLATPALGVTTTIAIIAHEIPQELGDFAVLLEAGYPRGQVLLYNLLSSLATIVGALLVVLLGNVGEPHPALLGLAAGSLIYIAAADLIPEIHRETKRSYMLAQSIALVVGATLIWFIVLLAE